MFNQSPSTEFTTATAPLFIFPIISESVSAFSLTLTLSETDTHLFSNSLYASVSISDSLASISALLPASISAISMLIDEESIVLVSLK